MFLAINHEVIAREYNPSRGTHVCLALPIQPQQLSMETNPTRCPADPKADSALSSRSGEGTLSGVNPIFLIRQAQ